MQKYVDKVIYDKCFRHRMKRKRDSVKPGYGENTRTHLGNGGLVQLRPNRRKGSVEVFDPVIWVLSSRYITYVSQLLSGPSSRILVLNPISGPG